MTESGDLDFALGDVVQLKSGGEKMIVCALERTSRQFYAECLCFVGHGAKKMKFPVAMLAPAGKQDSVKAHLNLLGGIEDGDGPLNYRFARAALDEQQH